MDFVTIRSSHNEADLLVLKSRLEAEGIMCFMKNQYTTQIMSHMSTFEVELQVAENNADRALEIIHEVYEQGDHTN